MIKITYVYKTLNENGEREIESVQTIKSKDYSKYVQKARKYNSDLDNELYISQVKDCSQTPTHTTCLIQSRAEKIRMILIFVLEIWSIRMLETILGIMFISFLH